MLYSQLKPHIVLLITTGLQNNSEIVNGDRTLLVFYKTKESLIQV